MKRTTIMLPDELDSRLRHEARRRGVSIADVARQAIDKQLAGPQAGALSFFSIGAGDPPDAARHVEDFVAPAISRRHPAS